MRMKLETIKALIDSMAGSSRPEAECREGTWTLKLSRALPDAGTATPTEQDGAPQDVSSRVVSPLYGIVHLQPSPDAPPFVTVGQQVAIGAPLCVIEAMKVFNNVTAERAGTIEAIVIGNGEEVDVGQLLMSIA
jgi:acetyl-CoA carboxylase biotin carboxyl carrier protein